jgi:hypothetical protein
VNAPRAYQEALDARVAAIRARYGFADDAMRRRHADLPAGSDDMISPEPARGPQLALPL